MPRVFLCLLLGAVISLKGYIIVFPPVVGNMLRVFGCMTNIRLHGSFKRQPRAQMGV